MSSKFSTLWEKYISLLKYFPGQNSHKTNLVWMKFHFDFVSLLFIRGDEQFTTGDVKSSNNFASWLFTYSIVIV